MVRQFPGQAERVETGAIQFGNDWPGLFLRGDDAIALRANIKTAIDNITAATPDRFTTLDLIFLDQDGERSLSAVLSDDKGEEMIGPFPFKGAFGPIAKRLCELRPLEFADEHSTEMTISVIHFWNLHRGENRAGQAYPLRLQRSTP
jgi:hypothetical protein